MHEINTIGDTVGCKFAESLISRNINLVKENIEKYPEYINRVVHSSGYTPLLLCCALGFKEAIPFLLDAGADINFQISNGESAILVALKMGNVEIMHLLATLNCDISVKDLNGKQIAHYAVLSGNSLVMAYCENVFNSSFSVCDNEGRTPLHYAVESGNVDFTNFLLKNGRVNVYARDAMGISALHLASANPHIAWRLLQVGGARLCHLKDNEGRTVYDTVPRTEKYQALLRVLATFSPQSFWPHQLSILHAPTFIWYWHLLQPFVLLWLSSALGLFLANVTALGQGWICFPLWILVSVQLSQHSHRTDQLYRMANPMYVGFYVSAVINSLLLFFLQFVPYVDIPHYLFVLVVITSFVFFFLLMSVLSSPSEVQEATEKNFITGESLSLQDLCQPPFTPVLAREKFCIVCERIPARPSKHCRLCCTCVRSLDHHCLFLVRCVSRGNQGRFVVLLFLTIVANTCFLLGSFAYFTAKLSVVKDLSAIHTIWNEECIPAFMCILNVVSLCWVVPLLFSQLIVISKGQTCFIQPPPFFARANLLTWREKFFNLSSTLFGVGRWTWDPSLGDPSIAWKRLFNRRKHLSGLPVPADYLSVQYALTSLIPFVPNDSILSRV